MEFIRKDNIIELSNPGVTSQRVLSAWHHAGCQKWHHLFKTEQSYYFEDASPASSSVFTIEIKNKSDFQNVRSKVNLFSKLY